MRVGLFATCLVDLMRPEIGFSVLKLLESAGYEVMVPEAQTCCGQPAYNSGERAVVARPRPKTLREFEMFDYVVIPSGSCGGMVRAHYQRPVARRPRTPRPLRAPARARVYELTDFLANVAKIADRRLGVFRARDLSRLLLRPARTRRQAAAARVARQAARRAR